MKIDKHLPTEILTALAQAMGFRVSYDRTPDVDEWTLSKGHGDTWAQYTGTRESVCGFLAGYSVMQLSTSQLLDKIDKEQRRLVNNARDSISAL